MTANARRPEPARIAVFAKAPVVGEVKTRLVPLLGAEGAAALHAGLVRHAIATAIAAGAGEVELWCAPTEEHPFFADCARESGVRLRRQEGADLGARMRHAFEASLAAGRALVVVGADCPSLGAADLREAVAALATHDVVVSPAEDGGYVLLGLARAVPALFAGIDWGTASVMGRTRALLAASGLAWKELATRWDVDRPEDYARLVREGLVEEVMS